MLRRFASASPTVLCCMGGALSRVAYPVVVGMLPGACALWSLLGIRFSWMCWSGVTFNITQKRSHAGSFWLLPSLVLKTRTKVRRLTSAILTIFSIAVPSIPKICAWNIDVMSENTDKMLENELMFNSDLSCYFRLPQRRVSYVTSPCCR